MSQYASIKNPPWVRSTVSTTTNLGQATAQGNSLATSILAAQAASHAPQAGQMTAVPTGTLATAAAVVAAAQQTPVSTTYGAGITAITLTQSALQQGAVLQQPGLTIPASLATTQVNNGVVVELARLPQPGVALPNLPTALPLATTQVATVSYPAPRLLAQAATFQNPQQHAHQAVAVVQQAAQQQQQQQSQALKQRIFTGTVTKLHENFGFVDEDVFFQINAVKGNLPKVGDRVLVEAAYNPNMPFKWNATRIQVLPNQVCPINIQQANNTRTALAQSAAMATTVMTAGPVSVGLNIPPGVNIASAVAGVASNQSPFANLNPQGRWTVPQEITVMDQLGTQRINVQYENRIEAPQTWIQDIEYTDVIENKIPRISAIQQRRHNSPPLPLRRDRERERDGRREERRDRYRERERYSPVARERYSPVSRERYSPVSRERYSPVSRKRSRSPRRPSRSPPRRRPRVAPRYTVQVPKISLDVKEGNVIELRKRYANLYIPSDFCSTTFLWQDAFPPHCPFSLDHPCNFHILSKESDPILDTDPLPEPTDTDHLYSAKVMLFASPPLKEIFKKSCALAEDIDDTKENFVHPTRLISFLVGLKGKNETVAIGGPWSRALDGPNPEKDPNVLIRTAIRTCKALTGIDLSKCVQWYRFAEINYRRGESTHKGRVLQTRVETVVLFLPDVWSCLPTRIEWGGLLTGDKNRLPKKLHEEPANTAQALMEKDEIGEKSEPTHFSDLDPKTIKVTDLKRELEVRNLSSKGLKSQLIARLTKAVKMEHEKDGEQTSKDDNNDRGNNSDDMDDRRNEDDEKRKDDKGKTMDKKVQLPENPSVLVQPSRTAKGGKFDCAIMSLSLLLDYRQEDNKEHSFEVSLFAEIFNEMMMRDFGFRIYRALVEAPDLKEDEKDKDKKKTDKKEDQKSKKDEKDDYRRKDDIDDSEKDDDSDDDEWDDKSNRNDRKRKKKKKQQMLTVDPYLLLSCVYYDQTHSGYIVDKDIEEILYTLGLHLSRAQVRKLVQKLCKHESFRYRKLTDKPVGDGDRSSNPGSPKVNLEELASGNKKLVSDSSETTKEDVDNAEDAQAGENIVKSSAQIVTYQGALVDVGKLLKQLERSEKSRLEAEQKLKELEVELDGVNELSSSKDKHSQKLSMDLEEHQMKLDSTEEELKRILLQSERYQRALLTCRDQLQTAMCTVDNALKLKTARSTCRNTDSYLKRDLDNDSNCSDTRHSSYFQSSSKSKDRTTYSSDDTNRNGTQQRRSKNSFDEIVRKDSKMDDMDSE